MLTHHATFRYCGSQIVKLPICVNPGFPLFFFQVRGIRTKQTLLKMQKKTGLLLSFRFLGFDRKLHSAFCHATADAGNNLSDRSIRNTNAQKSQFFSFSPPISFLRWLRAMHTLNFTHAATKTSYNKIYTLLGIKDFADFLFLCFSFSLNFFFSFSPCCECCALPLRLAHAYCSCCYIIKL